MSGPPRMWRGLCGTRSGHCKSSSIALGEIWSASIPAQTSSLTPASSLTQTFPSSTSSPENASILQQRLTMLSNLHNQATIDLAAKDKELCSTHERLSTLAQSTTSLTVTLTKRAEEAERELRWAKEGRQSAERREELAKKEADALRSTAVRLAPLRRKELTGYRAPTCPGESVRLLETTQRGSRSWKDWWTHTRRSWNRYREIRRMSRRL